LARREFLHVLTEAVHSDGATALLSSHIVTDVEQACDNLIVLGVGRVLLHASIADALATHAVSLRPRADAVASFAEADGSMLTLVRDSGDRSATLEEIVLGYLAAGRTAAVAA
jgi:ABC-2 type transport system ATP-binding protein